MKVIFLDFDGVITIPPTWFLSANKIKLIKKLVDETNSKIVLSTSWRSFNLEDTKNRLIERKKRCPRNKMFYWLIDNIYDITPHFCDNKYKNTGRGGEIQTWLDKHPKVENYIIIDDSDMLDSQLYHFIQTDYQTGFTEHEYELAYRVLMNKYIYNTLGLNFEIRDRWIKKCEGNNELWENTIKYNNLSKDFNNK